MKARRRTPRTTLAAAVLAMSLAAGCGGNQITNPRFQPEISNKTDSFQLQATAMSNVTDDMQWTWTHTDTVATVDQSSSITSGTATLTIEDASGSVVYSRTLTSDGTFSTGAGPAGDWTIMIHFSGVDGTTNFRVQ